MAGIDQLLAAASAHHQSGRLEDAERIYREALVVNPHCAEAWHGLGTIAYVAGRLSEASEYLEHALELEPNNPGAMNNLALAYQGERRLEEATACYLRAIELEPQFAEALFNLGNVFRERGRLGDAACYYRRALRINPAFLAAYTNLGAVLRAELNLEEAAICFRSALDIQPNDPDALYNLGLLRQDHGQTDEAIALYQRAITLDRSIYEAQTNLGALLNRQGKWHEAVQIFQQALEQQPDLAEVHSGLGKALYGLGRLGEAASFFRRAIELDPADADSQNNLGVVLHDQGFLAEAIECFRRTLTIRPNFAEARFNLGRALAELGHFQEAKDVFASALEIKPDLALAHCGLGLLMLAHGDYSNGWEEYEWRWKTEQLIPRVRVQPKWNGESLTGKTILLYAEQGLGDTIQFVRYAEIVKARGATVIVECQKALLKLLGRCPGIDVLLSAGDEIPSCDFHSPLMSLPRIVQTRLATIPNRVPYLFGDNDLTIWWRKNLKAIREFRIAINWRGEPGKLDSARRAIPLGMFAPLAQIAGVRLISVHKGEALAELEAARESMPIVDVGENIDTVHGAFMDTAAIMNNVDLVISSDTSTAHLAGALGVPVWVALPYVADWRWLLHRSDSPWYPTMRLFRQQQPGDWPSVFNEIRAALTALLAQKQPK